MSEIDDPTGYCNLGNGCSKNFNRWATVSTAEILQWCIFSSTDIFLTTNLNPYDKPQYLLPFTFHDVTYKTDFTLCNAAHKFFCCFTCVQVLKLSFLSMLCAIFLDRDERVRRRRFSFWRWIKRPKHPIIRKSTFWFLQLLTDQPVILT